MKPPRWECRGTPFPCNRRTFDKLQWNCIRKSILLFQYYCSKISHLNDCIVCVPHYNSVVVRFIFTRPVFLDGDGMLFHAIQYGKTCVRLSAKFVSKMNILCIHLSSVQPPVVFLHVDESDNRTRMSMKRARERIMYEQTEAIEKWEQKDLTRSISFENWNWWYQKQVEMQFGFYEFCRKFSLRCAPETVCGMVFRARTNECINF